MKKKVAVKKRRSEPAPKGEAPLEMLEEFLFEHLHTEAVCHSGVKAIAYVVETARMNGYDVPSEFVDALRRRWDSNPLDYALDEAVGAVLRDWIDDLLSNYLGERSAGVRQELQTFRKRLADLGACNA